jgi:hypothetical protein
MANHEFCFKQSAAYPGQEPKARPESCQEKRRREEGDRPLGAPRSSSARVYPRSGGLTLSSGLADVRAVVVTRIGAVIGSVLGDRHRAANLADVRAVVVTRVGPVIGSMLGKIEFAAPATTVVARLRLTPLLSGFARDRLVRDDDRCGRRADRHTPEQRAYQYCDCAFLHHDSLLEMMDHAINSFDERTSDIGLHSAAPVRVTPYPLTPAS